MNNNEYKDLYQSAPACLWRISIDDGRFLQANAETVHILGYDNFEELSKCSSPDLYEDVNQLITELQKTHADFRISMKKKNEKTIQLMMSVKIYPEKGYIEGTFSDITDTINMGEKINSSFRKIIYFATKN